MKKSKFSDKQIAAAVLVVYLPRLAEVQIESQEHK